MVRAEVEKVARIEGGFVLVSVTELGRAWRACRSAPLGIGDFRAWLACRELVARRCLASRARAVSYNIPELARLLGVSEKRTRAAVRRLEAAGLLAWTAEALTFPATQGGEREGSDILAAVDTIGRGVGSVAIPRRILRLLVGGARPALIATVLGVLLRCLSRRKPGWAGRGRIKASWIARTFDVDERRVKAARKELVALGWIYPELSGQRAENRWGRAYRIDLAWVRAESDGRSLPPRAAEDRAEIATPSTNQEPLPGVQKNQEPAGGPTGARLEGKGTEDKTLVDPTLDDVQAVDLKDTGRLLDLHRQAVAKGLLTRSEADQLRVVGAAEHALAVGKANPAGLFAYLVRGRCWRYLTTEDEDRANARIKAFLRGSESANVSVVASSRPIEPELSEDARIVREIRSAYIRAGIFRDPWPAFHAKNPGWDRGRWDQAMVELGLK